jgi:hypothetical protein
MFKQAPPRAAYRIEEFAALFSRHKSWAYRQIAKGKIKAITGYGITMIPAAEVDRILTEGAQASEGKAVAR